MAAGAPNISQGTSAPMAYRFSPSARTSFGLIGVAGICLLFGDISVSTLDPWSELERMAWGILTPDFAAAAGLGMVIVQTIAFALSGVALGAVAGFGLAQVFHIAPVRWACAAVRATD